MGEGEGGGVIIPIIFLRDVSAIFRLAIFRNCSIFVFFREVYFFSV